MTDFVVYINWALRQQYRNILDNKKIVIILSTKITCHNAHIFQIYDPM